MSNIKLSSEMLERANTIYSECIGCKKCMKNCIMLDSYCITPKELFGGIIKSGEMDVKIPYSCNLCNLCKEVCPKNIDQKEFFLELRRDVFKNHKKAIKPLGYRVVKFHQKNSFSKVFSTSTKKMEIVSNVAFIPGCSLMSYSPKIVMKTYEYLKSVVPGIKIILKCCANPTHTMGDQKGFKQYYSQLESEIEKLNVTEIITACPNCFISIKKNNPNLKITTVWEKIIQSGLPEGLLNKYSETDVKFTLHDPCPTRYEDNVQVSVRKIIKDIGITIDEFEFSKRQTVCCGAGAMVGITNSKLATVHMSKRAGQATSDNILTYCQTCAESLSIGEKNAVHLLDLMFNEEMGSAFIFEQQKNNFAKKWINRYNGKQKIKKL
ncbi:(Fe-S)-binding protein [Clostridium sp.]